MRNVPIAAYVLQHKTSRGPTEFVVRVRDKPGVYHSVEAALADERPIIAMCQKHNRTIELIVSLSVQTILRFNKYGRVSGSDKATQVLDPPFT